MQALTAISGSDHADIIPFIECTVIKDCGDVYIFELINVEALELMRVLYHYPISLPFLIPIPYLQVGKLSELSVVSPDLGCVVACTTSFQNFHLDKLDTLKYVSTKAVPSPERPAGPAGPYRICELSPCLELN